MALPLDGVKVLDFTAIMAGPYCTLMLADMGADVVKIEAFPEGDGSRRFDPKVNGESYCFAVLNRNKQSVGLNMKDARGKEIFMKLARDADIIMENYRPGRHPQARDRLRIRQGDQPGHHLLLGVRLRPDRALQPEGRLRHNRAGHERDHDHDRRAGRPSREGRHSDERHRGGLDGALLDTGRVHQAPEDRRGRLSRHLSPGSGPRVDVLGSRRFLRGRGVADRHRHAPPALDAVPGLPHAGRLRYRRGRTTKSCGRLSAGRCSSARRCWRTRASRRLPRA